MLIRNPINSLIVSQSLVPYISITPFSSYYSLINQTFTQHLLTFLISLICQSTPPRRVCVWDITYTNPHRVSYFMCRTVHPGYVPPNDPEYEETMTKITQFTIQHEGWDTRPDVLFYWINFIAAKSVIFIAKRSSQTCFDYIFIWNFNWNYGSIISKFLNLFLITLIYILWV